MQFSLTAFEEKKVTNKRKLKASMGLILIITIMTGMFFGCGKEIKTNRYEADFVDLFDTASKIVGYTTDKGKFENQTNFIYDELKVYNDLFDIYNGYEGINNLKTVNDNAGIKPVKVDKKLIALLLFSKEIYQLTDGKVNIAFGSVLKVWHTYREAGIALPQEAALPPMEVLLEANKHTDINKMIIDEQASTVYLADKDMSLDVGAVAKGYATEQVALDVEKKEGITSMLLSIGGNVRSIGEKGNQEGPWKVGVQNPDKEDGTSLLHTVALVESSLVTSGDYQRYYFVNGKRYHHIIDPETLMPANHYRAVSILTKDSGIADGLSTAAFIMPLEEAKALIEKVEGTEAVFVMPDGHLEYTSGFKNYIQ